jgi:hypothetical protein
MAKTRPAETRTVPLPVTLTKDEILARGKELARVKDEHTRAADELETAQLAWKTMKEGFANRISEAEDRMRQLARAINSGVETRDVEVCDEPEFKAGVMNTVRLDTGELVSSRGLTEAERQRSLFRPEKGAKAAASAE